jgi:hypothetical protein
MMAAGAVPGVMTTTAAVSATVATAMATAAVSTAFRKDDPRLHEEYTRDRQRGGREPHDALSEYSTPDADRPQSSVADAVPMRYNLGANR